MNGHPTSTQNWATTQTMVQISTDPRVLWRVPRGVRNPGCYQPWGTFLKISSKHKKSAWHYSVDLGLLSDAFMTTSCWFNLKGWRGRMNSYSLHHVCVHFRFHLGLDPAERWIVVFRGSCLCSFTNNCPGKEDTVWWYHDKLCFTTQKLSWK